MAQVDEGFAEITDLSCINVQPKSKLYLIRLPKDVEYKHLDGVKLNVSKIQASSEPIASFNSGGMRHEIRKDSLFATTRAIVEDKVVGGYTIGPAFHNALCIRKDFASSLIKKDQANIGAIENLQLSFAYERLEQIDDLSIRSMPKGSLSTLEELNNRLKQVEVESVSRNTSSIVDETPLKRQKVDTSRGHHSSSNSSSSRRASVDGEDREDKKSKKEKKEKKDKKDKKH